MPEALIQLGDYQAIASVLPAMSVNKNAFAAEDIEAYKDAFAKRGTLTSALNYYRNSFRQGLTREDWRTLEVPTLMIWGEDDAALGKELTYGTDKYVNDFQIKYIPNCGHWVQQEKPQLVNDYIREFISG
ncbi:alpha/beta fold hydrolase [Phormidesmis sp. 146-33]